MSTIWCGSAQEQPPLGVLSFDPTTPSYQPTNPARPAFMPPEYSNYRPAALLQSHQRFPIRMVNNLSVRIFFSVSYLSV